MFHRGDVLYDPKYRELSSHPYWERVWIIQEVGTARSIKVLFDDECLTWPYFINEVISSLSDPKRFKYNDCGPLRMRHLIQNRYKNSHNLVNLLKTHQRSKCKDPRDKVYGFIGLASDCYEFPLDYGKTTYEVWQDTISFITVRRLKNSLPILELAQLVKELLGCDTVAHSKPVGSSLKDPLIKLKAFRIGAIVELGPSTKEILAEVNAAGEWKALVYREFHFIAGEAMKENDALMQVLETLKTSDLDKVTSFNKPKSELSIADYESTATGASSHFEKSATSSACKLFLYTTSTLGVMGICEDACVGDLICALPNLNRVLIVRQIANRFAEYVRYQAVGTALLSTHLLPWKEKEHGIVDFELGITANDLFGLLS